MNEETNQEQVDAIVGVAMANGDAKIAEESMTDRIVTNTTDLISGAWKKIANFFGYITLG